MTRKIKVKRGRPTRAEASRKALARVDPASIDPLAVLREIAADTSAPASARVAAARCLLVVAAPPPPTKPKTATGGNETDTPLSRRALEIMTRRPN